MNYRGYGYTNVINYPYIDYIIKCYVPELQSNEKKYGKVNMEHFREAMLHISTKYGDSDKTYERLEYLGDAIFHMIITEYFYKRYDEENEGFLTRLTNQDRTWRFNGRIGKILELDLYIQIENVTLSDNILEDVFEAFIGAFYLNFGMQYTKKFVIKVD